MCKLNSNLKVNSRSKSKSQGNLENIWDYINMNLQNINIKHANNTDLKGKFGAF